MHFKSLGVMLDCSRNAVMKVDELKRYITVLNKMGYNQFQLYTEETYEVEGEPFFGYHRGRYTVEELQEIDAFCASINVELIPNIQTLAHLWSALHWDAYEKIRDTGDILLVDDEATYTFIENLFKSLRKAFRSNKVHIGMDEAHELGRGAYMDKHGEVDRSEILLSHLKRVCAIAEKYGFEPMMWSDMFYRLANGGEYFVSNATFSPEIREKIPENLTLVYWDYYGTNRKNYDGMIKGHKMLSDKIAFAGGAWKWAGFASHNTYSLRSTKAAIPSCIENGIKDVIFTCWGDNGAECSAWAILPSLCYGACLAQGITKMADVKAKFQEWTGYSFDDFMMLDLPDRLSDDLTINPSKYTLYNDCFMGLFDRNISEKDAKVYATNARRLKNAAKRTGEYAYIFENLSNLCSLLSIKVDLGIRTKEAFFSGNMDAVETIIKDYNKTIKKLEIFYDSFKMQWFKENKPHGFDVQDIRLGGLMMRLRSCRDRLIAYTKGEIDDIPELHDETLVFRLDRHINYNNWEHSVTANRMNG